ncbi:hypothetical protein [Halovenus marina]|uniref:zinc ribbon domain-containing protein n=1 Tax=Halovenus marina TaxID=3396621 RepID=UPI003F5648D7
MHDANADPRCPECGEPVGQTATYCMHCSAEFPDGLDEDGGIDQSDESGFSAASDGIDGDSVASTVTAQADSVVDAAGVGTEDGRLLDPDGFVDNTLTVVVGIGGGIVVGLVGTFVLLAMTNSLWALLLGFFLWLGATAYLVRRRTVQGAVAATGYAVALVLLAMPFITLSPFVAVEGGLQERIVSFLVFFLTVLIPAGIAAGIGLVAAQFVPDGAAGSEG